MESSFRAVVPPVFCDAVMQKMFNITREFVRNSIQFNLKKTLIIPQGAILLWSWRARKNLKKIIKVKRTITPIKETYFNHSKVMNIEQL